MTKHFFVSEELWETIYGSGKVPEYVNRAFETAKEYVDDCNPDYKGLLLLFDHPEHFEKLFRDRCITKIKGRKMNKKREGIESFIASRGRRVLDSHTKEFYELIGHSRDSSDGMEGAVAIDLDGNYVDSGLFIEGVTSRNIQVLADTGARHRAGAFASKNYVDYTVVVSEETGRVTVFRNGQTYNGMSYIPKTKESPVEEPEGHFFSEDARQPGQDVR